jgi:hypothetical protein
MCVTVAGATIRYLQAMTRIRVLAPFLLVLSLVACTSEDPAPAPTVASPAPASASPASPAAYRHTVIDLCEKLDLAPLTPLRLTVREKRAAVPPGFTEDKADQCLHEMTTAAGKIARLTVTAIVTGTPAEARREFEAPGKLKPVGPVTGPWQQGAARTLDTESGFKQTQFEVYAVSDNLYLSVWLTVGGDAYTPPRDLQPAVAKIAETTFATVSTAWKR